MGVHDGLNTDLTFDVHLQQDASYDSKHITNKPFCDSTVAVVHHSMPSPYMYLCLLHAQDLLMQVHQEGDRHRQS